MSEYYIEVEEVIRDSDKAILVRVSEDEKTVIAAEDCDRTREVWIPKSQIHEDSEVSEVGDVGTLVVNEWFAEERGW